MMAHEVAGHILAKIDEIVQSGEIEDVAQNIQNSNWTAQAEAKIRLEIYISALNAVAGYAAVEPRPPEAAGTVAENERPPSNFRH